MIGSGGSRRDRWGEQCVKRRQHNIEISGNFWDDWLGATTKDESGGEYHPDDKNKLRKGGREEAY